MEKKTGTLEWAEKNINIFKGQCKNKCVYCYSTANISRYKQETTWKLNDKVFYAQIKKNNYVTMYPSAHDIRYDDIEFHMDYLLRFVEAGNKVLIVSKPEYKSIDALILLLGEFKEQVEFRFTIGSINDTVLKFFDTNAPGFNERLECLKLAFKRGFKTSISIEPMLDATPENVVAMVSQYVTGDIWIGKMRNIKSRLKLNGYKELIYYPDTIDNLIKFQADDNRILDIVNNLSNVRNIKWKDSIQEVLNKAYHIIYTDSFDYVNSLYKLFNSFKECEEWVGKQDYKYYEIGRPDEKR